MNIWIEFAALALELLVGAAVLVVSRRYRRVFVIDRIVGLAPEVLAVASGTGASFSFPAIGHYEWRKA